MTSQVKLPAGIGPHEGRELDLLLSGQKPMAMFSDVVPASFDWGETDFDPYVQRKQILKRETFLEREGLTFRFVYFCLPSEEVRIDQLHEINTTIFTGVRPATEEDDIQTGRLLGYTEDDISTYIEWSREIRGTREKIEEAHA